MVSKHEQLRQLLQQRIAESPQHLPSGGWADFLTTPGKTHKQLRQDFANLVEEIQRKERAKEEAKAEAEEAARLAQRNADAIWLWDGTLPVSAELPWETIQKLEADDTLRRLATEGLYGWNWYEFTTILRDKYGLYETGYAIDRKHRLDRDQEEMIDWKLYIQNRPDVAAKSIKLTRREIMPSGYARITPYEKQRRAEYRARHAARERARYAAQRAQKPPRS